MDELDKILMALQVDEEASKLEDFETHDNIQTPVFGKIDNESWNKIKESSTPRALPLSNPLDKLPANAAFASVKLKSHPEPQLSNEDNKNKEVSRLKKIGSEIATRPVVQSWDRNKSANDLLNSFESLTKEIKEKLMSGEDNSKDESKFHQNSARNLSARSISTPTLFKTAETNIGQKRIYECAACLKPIQKGGSMFSGKAYHKEHFVCSVCRISLCGQVVFEKESIRFLIAGFLFCENDYHTRFSPVCAYCDEPIKKNAIEAYNFLY